MADEPTPAEWNDEDVADFAKQFQDAASAGGFDPFSLLTGERQLHSVFLAPMSKQLLEARERLVRDGSGPLAGLVEQFQRAQHCDRDQARLQAGQMLAAAQGMLVVLLRDDQGFVAIPQLFFGHLEEAFCQHAVELCGKDFPDPDGLRACLVGLRNLAERQLQWPELVIARQGSDRPERYWPELAEAVIDATDEALLGAQQSRLADLAFWISDALATLLAAERVELDGNDFYNLARLGILAGDAAAGCAWADRLLSDYEPEDEALAELLDQLVRAGVRAGEADQVLAFLRRRRADCEAVLAGCYELEYPTFVAHVAALVAEDELIAAAERLQRVDRKSFRHDLNREPIWRIGVEPGPLLETDEAAERIDRSVQFVAKRLEQGAIPFFVDGDQVRIPERALERWSALMRHFDLLD